MVEHMFVEAGGGREPEAMRLEAELAEVCGVVNAATARMVELIAKVVATGSWSGWGVRSAEHWVAWKCGVSAGRARALVAMARRLPVLPVTGEAFTAGELSEDQVRLVCRHAPTDTDTDVAEFARHATVSQLSRTLSSYHFAPDPEAASGTPAVHEPELVEERRVSFGTTDDGGWRLTARLPVDEGALVERALSLHRSRLFTDHGDGEPTEVTWADALAAMADASTGADSRRRRSDRTTVMLHLDTTPGTGIWSGHLHGGPGLPDTLRRYLDCDATVRPVFEHHGVPVSVGRRRRTVPDHTRTLIEERDRGCRVPGCPRTRWLEAHHIVHWEAGGPTDTSNLVALCAPHHRAHHHHRLGITGDADQPDGLVFTDHTGRALRANAPPVPPRQPPDQAAAHHGIPTTRWQPPTGERLQTGAVHFNQRAP